MNAPPEVSAAYIASTDKQRALALALAQGMGKEQAMLAAGYSKVQAHKTPRDVLEHPRVVLLAAWYAESAIQKDADKVEKVVSKMTDIALFDPKAIYNADGKLLPVNEWGEAERFAFAGFDSQGMPKFWNPMDAAEKLFKVKGTYAAEKHVHDVNPLVALMEAVQGAALPVVGKDPDHE